MPWAVMLPEVDVFLIEIANAAVVPLDYRGRSHVGVLALGTRGRRHCDRDHHRGSYDEGQCTRDLPGTESTLAHFKPSTKIDDRGPRSALDCSGL